MEYGIKMIENNVFCANCGRLISNKGEYNDKFCYVCGNPLKMEAVEAREKEIQEAMAKNTRK